MEEADKGLLMIRVGEYFFWYRLMAHLGSTEQRAVERMLLLLLFTQSRGGSS